MALVRAADYMWEFFVNVYKLKDSKSSYVVNNIQNGVTAR